MPSKRRKQVPILSPKDYSMNNSFVKSATLIMVATLVAKIIGACYRVPLTIALGTSGMGVYQLVYPVYALMLTASSGAIPTAISILVSEKSANGNLKEGNLVAKSALAMLLIFTAIIAVALVLLSGLIAELQGAESARLGYILIAPAVVFSSGIAVLRGYFQGRRISYPTAVSHVSEAVVKLVVGLGLAYSLKPYGVVAQVGGALLGVSVSEGVTFLIIYILFKRKNRGCATKLNYLDAGKRYREILKISLPITIGGMIFPLTQFIDSFMVVNILKQSLGSALATSSYGLFSGQVNALINLPISLSLALGIMVVPHISKDKEERDLEAIRLKTSTAIKSAVLIGVPFSVLFMVAPRQTLSLLYSNLTESELAIGGSLLVISAPTVLLISITQICTSVLQGLKEFKRPIVNLIIGGVLKTVLGVALLYKMGIKGVAYAGLVAFTVVALLNLTAIFRLMGKNGDIVKNSGVILLFGAIIGVSLTIAVALKVSALWIMVITILSGIVYLTLVMTSKVFSASEILSLPFGKKLIKLKKR